MHDGYSLWYVIPVSWVKYIFFRNESFYLANVQFCCRHNILHKTEWPHYVVYQQMSIELVDNVHLIPSLFHYGILKCGHPRCFKIHQIGGCFEDENLLYTYHQKSYPFLCGYIDVVKACHEFGSNGNENELSKEVKTVMSHYFLSKIIQTVFACEFCFGYFDSFMKFMVFVAKQATSELIRNHCHEKDLVNLVDDDKERIIDGFCSLKQKSHFMQFDYLNPFSSILLDHSHVEVLGHKVYINNFNYSVSWNVSHCR